MSNASRLCLFNLQKPDFIILRPLKGAAITVNQRSSSVFARTRTEPNLASTRPILTGAVDWRDSTSLAFPPLGFTRGKNPYPSEVYPYLTSETLEIPSKQNSLKEFDHQIHSEHCVLCICSSTLEMNLFQKMRSQGVKGCTSRYLSTLGGWERFEQRASTTISPAHISPLARPHVRSLNGDKPILAGLLLIVLAKITGLLLYLLVTKYICFYSTFAIPVQYWLERGGGGTICCIRRFGIHGTG
ncbi:hypothetical protein C8F04DRAFT_1197700 [Mycena alexandri]|uniref:Uncharacterized protein n=1 Tax=Mycena alexandri TaxID=1745969 RepID=A0AAD6WQ07_9AGAR|nr:hypothetical protein C8F04DRAFT_1197700 [Mycena alexandri]